MSNERKSIHVRAGQGLKGCAVVVRKDIPNDPSGYTNRYILTDSEFYYINFDGENEKIIDINDQNFNTLKANIIANIPASETSDILKML